MSEKKTAARFSEKGKAFVQERTALSKKKVKPFVSKGLFVFCLVQIKWYKARVKWYKVKILNTSKVCQNNLIFVRLILLSYFF